MQRYIPANAIEEIHANINAVIYRFINTQNKPCVIAYSGRKKKPTLHFWYSNEAQRETRIASWVKTLTEQAEQAAARKAEQAAFQTTLKVDDILYASWGWEQTNIDFYQVIAVAASRKSITVRKIAERREDYSAQHMSGYVWPIANQFDGPAMSRRVKTSNHVQIDSIRLASLWDGKRKGFTCYG